MEINWPEVFTCMVFCAPFCFVFCETMHYLIRKIKEKANARCPWCGGKSKHNDLCDDCVAHLIKDGTYRP